MKTRSIWLAIAVVSGYGVGQFQGPEAPKTIELKDDNGVVRVRLGALSKDLGYGVEVVDAQGRHAAVLRNDGSVTTVQLASTLPESLVALVSSPEGSRLALGAGSGEHVVAGVDVDGTFRLAMRDGKKKPTVEVVSRLGDEPGTVMRMDNGADAGIQLRVDKKRALVELLRDKLSAARLEVANGAHSALELGDKGRGIALRTSANGDMRFGFFRDAVEFVVQAVKGKGTAIVVNRPTGEPAIRLGVLTDGEIQDQRLRKDGRPIRK